MASKVGGDFDVACRIWDSELRFQHTVALRTDGRVAEISASGDGNIAMWIYSSDGDSDLLVNEIDEFEGSVRLPDCSDLCWIDVDGDMTYSLNVRS